MSCEEQTTRDTNCFCETITKVIQPCIGFFSNFSLGYPIYPSEPAGPQHSEYMILKSGKRLRIIHITPNIAKEEPIHLNKDNKLRTSRNSLSEEYWFTRWNKPLKLGICSCSFRRSQRFSIASNHITDELLENRTSTLSNFSLPPRRIINLETFVERIIQETFFEAFQEYFVKSIISKNKLSDQNGGISNLGYFISEDELDGVVLRKPIKLLKEIEENKISSNNALKIKPKEKHKSCAHGSSSRVKKKPIVMLLHGIGSSADVWWNIINSFIYKGYEIVAPDMLGHGFSSVPNKESAYKFKNILKYTISVFDHYVGSDSSKTAIIIGHSYGCSLATALCRYRSQQIIQLILISGGGPTPLAPPVIKSDATFMRILRVLMKPLLLCGVKRTIFYSSRGKHFDVNNIEGAVPQHILHYIAIGQNWAEGDAAFHRRILIPTLLVHGLQDTHITLVQECEMERTIPRAFLELIPNAGHMSMLDTPEHLSHMIMCFIDWWSR